MLSNTPSMVIRVRTPTLSAPSDRPRRVHARAPKVDRAVLGKVASSIKMQHHVTVGFAIVLITLEKYASDLPSSYRARTARIIETIK